MSIFAQLLRRRRPNPAYVRLEFEEGPPVLLGPMDRFTAEVLLVNRISPNPIHDRRRVVSARIIGDGT